MRNYKELMETFSLEQLIKERIALDDLYYRTNKEEYQIKLNIVRDSIFIKINEIL
jgi:hypothetical protein